MKKVVVLIGPNGVGKSTTAEIFMQKHTKIQSVVNKLQEGEPWI